MRWAWSAEKNKTNRQKHGLSFDTAQLVFEDPLAATRLDTHAAEERWQTVGVIGNVSILVVHTWPARDEKTGEETGRIISARKATKQERRAYEEGEF